MFAQLQIEASDTIKKCKAEIAETKEKLKLATKARFYEEGSELAFCKSKINRLEARNMHLESIVHERCGMQNREGAIHIKSHAMVDSNHRDGIEIELESALRHVQSLRFRLSLLDNPEDGDKGMPSMQKLHSPWMRLPEKSAPAQVELSSTFSPHDTVARIAQGPLESALESKLVEPMDVAQKIQATHETTENKDQTQVGQIAWLSNLLCTCRSQLLSAKADAELLQAQLERQAAEAAGMRKFREEKQKRATYKRNQIVLFTFLFALLVILFGAEGVLSSIKSYSIFFRQ